MFYDEVSSVKWSTSGAIDNGLGKSFLGSTSWSQPSMSKHEQASEDYMTLELIFSSPIWEGPKPSIFKLLL